MAFFIFLRNKPDSRLLLILNNLAFVLFDFRSKDQPIPHKIVFLSYNLAR